jgi:hypothetical protein
MEIAVYQLVAYVLLSIASVTVAVTSAILGYRQMFGWEPTVFVTGIGSAKDNNAIVTFEVWNRRKYPIALTGGSSIDFGKTKLVERPSQSGWQRYRSTMCYYGEKIIIEPLSFREFVVEADFADSAIEDKWQVRINFFDPVSNKEVTISAIARTTHETPEASKLRGRS